MSRIRRGRQRRLSMSVGGSSPEPIDSVDDEIDTPSPIWEKREDMEEWKPTDPDLPLYVLTGRLKYIPPPLNKVVKIFLSSTFTDMYVERNYLYANIYPELQDYCRLNYDLEFQVVDMRWGVRDEASLDHSGPKTCMDELQSCQELSLGPNFVCLLGQRYGSRALQATISKSEFDVIVKALKSLNEEEGLALLTDWYRSDENGLPPSMILTALNERKPEVTYSDFSKNISGKLHRSLRIGAEQAVTSGDMTEQDSRKYFWSVTEEEVCKGVLSQPDAKDHCLCFQRTLIDIDYNHEKAWRFVELKEGTDKPEVDKVTTGLITKLVEDTVKYLGPDNCHAFDPIPWSKDGGTNEKSLQHYLQELGELFTERVTMLIDRAAGKVNPLRNHQNANLLTEILEHGYQAIDKQKTFQGRDDIMDKLKGYILSKSDKPFIMYGESGFGKTSLLAVASMRVYDWCGDHGDLIVIRRFLGTTPDSTNIGSLLHSVTKQIALACNFKPPHADDPIQAFLLTVMSIPHNFRVVIFLDSLDQLSAYGKAHTLNWLPRSLPSHVKIIVSTLPKDHGLLDILKDRSYSGKQFVEVNVLKIDLAMKLMEDWLRACGRKLTKDQFKVVKKRFRVDENTSPLYIKLIFDVVVKMRSYKSVSKLTDLLKNINSPVKCIRYIYEELMKKNGDLLVHRLFAYLHLSNSGLTENELVDLISLDDEVLTDVFQYHAPPLRRLPAVLWARIRNSIQEYIVTREANGGKVIAWYHRQFVEVGDTMYKEEFPMDYKKPENIKDCQSLCDAIRENMVDYFSGVWSGVKKPFRYSEELCRKLKLDSPDSEADRFVPAMPNIKSNGRPNLRKLGQLPALLIKLGRIEEFFIEVFGNIEGLVGLFSMYSWSDIFEITDGIDYSKYKAIGKDKDDVHDQSFVKQPLYIMIRSFLLMSSLTSAYPKMLGPLTLGRLLPFASGSKILNDFINGVYEKGPKMNAFVCPHVQLEGVGSCLIFDMTNDHVGPCVALIEVIPKGDNYVLTVSKKAVLFNMEGDSWIPSISEKAQADLTTFSTLLREQTTSYLEDWYPNYIRHRMVVDGNIQMRYMPPDLRKDDSFHLVAAADPFDDPEEVAASLKIVPRIYIFSLSSFDIAEIIDCRENLGSEEMRIHALQMYKLESGVRIILVHGNPSDGLLVYDMKAKTLIYKFQNNKPILFMNIQHEGNSSQLVITQPQREIRIKFGLTKEESPVQGKQEEQKLQFKSERRETKLSLPRDSVITARKQSEDEETSAFTTDDGHVYVGTNCSIWTRILLDSPAHDIDFPQGDRVQRVFTACTKYYSYIIMIHPEKIEHDLHLIDEKYRGLQLKVVAKMKLLLSKLCLVNEKVLVGYHLGQLYFFRMDNIDDGLAIFPFRKFDAHSRPITGIIVNEDVAEMVLTSAEDGSVRAFHAGMIIHPFLQEAHSFDRMTVPVHRISATKACATSLSTESSSVTLWDNSNAKITGHLEHNLPDDDILCDVVCFDERVITVTTNGLVSFWNISQSPARLMDQLIIGGYQKLTRGCEPYEVLVKCATSWQKFDAKTGQQTSEKRYEDRTILKYHYINGQLSLLQVLTEEKYLLVEIINDNQQETVNLSEEKQLECEKLQDFFCCENFLALIFPRECVFYNWKQKEVLGVEKLNKPILIPSNSNTLLLRSNCNIQSYQIKQGKQEKLSPKPMKLQEKDDQVVITPDGLHVIVIEQKKMLTMYRIGNLEEHIGQYSVYGEIERVAFSDDSSYLILGIADTRLFYLLLCDVTVKGHHQRALDLRRNDYTVEEQKKGKILVSAAGEKQNSSYDKSGGDGGILQDLNTLHLNMADKYLNKVEALMISRKHDQGYNSLRAMRASRTRRRVKVTEVN